MTVNQNTPLGRLQEQDGNPTFTREELVLLGAYTIQRVGDFAVVDAKFEGGLPQELHRIFGKIGDGTSVRTENEYAKNKHTKGKSDSWITGSSPDTTERHPAFYRPPVGRNPQSR